MGEPEELRLRHLTQPGVEHTGRLISIEGTAAVLELPGDETLAARALVEFTTSQTLYLGEVASSRKTSSGCEVHVRLEHKLDLAAIQRIQQVWTEGRG